MEATQYPQSLAFRCLFLISFPTNDFITLTRAIQTRGELWKISGFEYLNNQYTALNRKDLIIYPILLD